eukprot:358891-Chlamydomonas_euryale.AAC.6
MGRTPPPFIRAMHLDVSRHVQLATIFSGAYGNACGWPVDCRPTCYDAGPKGTCYDAGPKGSQVMV